MSRKCEICGKGQVSGNNVSHSNRHTKRKWNANIQNVRIEDEDGVVLEPSEAILARANQALARRQIGRASCRERV